MFQHLMVRRIFKSSKLFLHKNFFVVVKYWPTFWLTESRAQTVRLVCSTREKLFDKNYFRLRCLLPLFVPVSYAMSNTKGRKINFACERMKRASVDFREVLRLKDGGEVALDWLEVGCQSDAPIVLILPGLTGESQAEYIKCLVAEANSKGIKCVVFNNRGLGIPLKTARLYCAANCEDLREVVHHVRSKCPDVRIGATGISMGGMILGNFLTRRS